MGTLLAIAGLLPFAATSITAFKALHLDVSHGITGVYVGQLNEQHPWLYKTLRLTNHGPTRSAA
jgi:hypothetical protein